MCVAQAKATLGAVAGCKPVETLQRGLGLDERDGNGAGWTESTPLTRGEHGRRGQGQISVLAPATSWSVMELTTESTYAKAMLHLSRAGRHNLGRDVGRGQF